MIINIHETPSDPMTHVGGEWISYDIEIITDNNHVIHVSDECIECIVSRIVAGGSSRSPTS